MGLEAENGGAALGLRPFSLGGLDGEALAFLGGPIRMGCRPDACSA